MINLPSILKKLQFVENLDDQLSPDDENKQQEPLKITNNIVSKAVVLESNVNFLEAVKHPDNQTEIPNNKKKNDEGRKQMDYEKLTKIEEIYDLYHIPNSSINTIFMADNFIKALPDNLPAEVKKMSVLNIISASGVEMDNLLKDGEYRLDVLSKFMKEFKEHSETNIFNYKLEIEKLYETISTYKNRIEQYEKLLSEQDSLVNFEVDHINSIVHFIGKKSS